MDLFCSPRGGRGPVLVHVRGQPFDALLETLALHGNHAGELGLGALGSAPAEVALAALGADDFAGAGHSEALGSCFMGF